MIRMHVSWEDEVTGKKWEHEVAFNARDAQRRDVEDLDELARYSFDRMWNELVRVRTMDLAQHTRARAFPIRLGSGVRGIAFVPWDMVMMHEGRIMKSYGCSVGEVALRGGLSYVELCEVLEGWPCGSIAADEQEAAEAVRQAVRLFRESHGPGSYLSVVS